MIHGQWIAPANTGNIDNIYFRASREFTLEQVPECAELRIACESYYLLEINGRVAGRGPARGTRSTDFYDAADLSSFLLPGHNRIEVLVRYTANANSTCCAVAPGLWLEWDNCVVSDAKWSIVLCSTEWPAKAPWFTQQAGFCEWHDFRHRREGIPVPTLTAGADSPLAAKVISPRETPLPVERVWPAADIPVVCQVPPADMSRDIAELSTKEPHLPAAPELKEALAVLTTGGVHEVTIPVQPGGNGVAIIFDFDHEVSGRVEIEVEAPADTVADIAYEEQLWQGDRLRADHSHTNPTYHFSDRSVLADGRCTLGNLLVDRGFRMVQLTLRNFTAPVKIRQVRAIDRRYPLGRRGAFFCGDYKLNRLWDICGETLSACVTDMFTDCPWRERLFYINDMLVANKTMLAVFGDYRLTRQALKTAFEEQADDDLITSSCPGEGHFDSPFAVILSANLTLPLIIYDFWLHSGDSGTVKKYYGNLKRIMRRFTSWLDADGILNPPADYWNFFDWSYELNGTIFTGKKTALLNYLFIIAAETMKRLAEICGEEPDRSIDTDKLREQTFKAFWSEKEQVLLDGFDCDASPEVLTMLGVPPGKHRAKNISRLTHAMALLAGADQGHRKELEAALLNEELLAPDYYYFFFLLDAMTRMGSVPKAAESMDKYWSIVLDSGSPTIWEDGVHEPGKLAFGGSASLCHAFSTAPAMVLQQQVLGITPLTAGFRSFKFQPAYTKVGFAKGRVPTPHGNIAVSWQLEAGTISAELTVPPFCTAETPCGVLEAGVHSISFNVE